jgi:uncharacterized protein (DUF1015 family)
MNIKSFQAIYPKLDLIASPESFFGTVKYQYREYFQSGFFEQDSEDSIFIYDISTKTRKHRGIISCISIDDYDQGNVVMHENTLAAKEQKTIHLIMQREAMVKPALLTYKGNEKLDQLLEQFCQNHEPFYTLPFTENEQLHSFYKISDKETLNTIIKIFGDEIKKAYIADGHHRFSAISLLNKSNSDFDFSKILVSLFPFQELEILDFNRTIQILHELSPTLVMVKISKLFEINYLDKGRKPNEKHEIILLINKEWYSLRWKKEILEKYQKQKIILDANLLNELLLQNEFGIKEFGSDIRIGYVSGKDGVNAMLNTVNKNEYRIGFILFPVTIDEMIYISDENLTLPPKSTWFEPRIINGLISKSI